MDDERSEAGRRRAPWMGRGRWTAAVVAAVLGGAGGASGAPVTAVDVLAPRQSEPQLADVAVNDAGRSVSVWTARAGAGFAVIARVRPGRSAPWRPAARLSAIVSARPLAPRIALGESGTALAVWRLAAGRIESATLGRAPGARWSRRTVAAGAGEGFTAPAVATGAGGTAAWAERVGESWHLRRARLSGGVWRVDPAVDLAASGLVPAGAPPALPPDIAVNLRGASAVVWPASESPPSFGERGPGQRVSVALRPAGAAAWEPPTLLSPSGTEADVALGAGGHAAVAWLDADGPLRTAVREPGAAAWPTGESLTGPAPSGTGARYPRLALNEEGYAVLGWGSTARSLDLEIRARLRSGASGLWGPERLVSDQFQFFSVIELASMKAAVDRYRLGYLAWFDPQGPGSAAVNVATGGSASWRLAASVNVLEDIGEPSLAASARGGAVVVTPAAVITDSPNRPLVAARFPPPARFALTPGQLLTNQRISQGAVRRVNAALARLADGLAAEHIRDGSLAAGDFGDGVRIEGTPTGAAVPANPIAPLDIAAPPAGGPGDVRLSAAQLRINQRISQVALARANFGRQLLALGLTGAQVADGAITAAKLLPGLRVAAGVPSPVPLPESPVFRPPLRGDGRVVLTTDQLRINQRISQAAILRANWLVERLEGGIQGEDIRNGGLRAEDLAPGG